MFTEPELEEIVLAEPRGKKRVVKITARFLGGAKSDRNNYRFNFNGDGVTSEGHLMCLGPSGHTEATKHNRIVIRFQLIAAGKIKGVVFQNPEPPNQVEFTAGEVVGESEEGVCPSLVLNSEEFEGPIYDPQKRDQIIMINKKKNSDKGLGYAFSVWVEHWNGEVHRIEYDPRIINR
jgi:hypothetical protein